MIQTVKCYVLSDWALSLQRVEAKLTLLPLHTLRKRYADFSELQQSINNSFANVNYSRLSLSQSQRDPLKHFEISVLRLIRCVELRKIPKQPNFTNDHVIGLL